MKSGIKILLIVLAFSIYSFATGFYTVKKGDSLNLISKKFNVSVEDLIKENNLKKPYIIRPGQRLKIPRKKIQKKKSKALKNCSIIYQVKSGDTLITIAKKYHVWVKDLKKINNLKSDILRAGQYICIKKGKSFLKRKSKHKEVKIRKKVITKIVYHKVKSGDSIALIARKYKTSVKEIIRLNNLKKPYIIRPGQKLKVPKKEIKIIKITEEDKIRKISRLMPFGFIWPVENGTVSAKFVNSSTLRHLGIDIKSGCNKPIKAAESGKVIYAGDSIKAFGNLVIIKHIKRYNTVYGHIGKLMVRDGQYVKKGQLIGFTGKLNNSEDCGVYFEIRKNAVPVDPLVLLPKKEVQNK